MFYSIISLINHLSLKTSIQTKTSISDKREKKFSHQNRITGYDYQHKYARKKFLCSIRIRFRKGQKLSIQLSKNKGICLVQINKT